MSSFYLELYQDPRKIPDAFADLPGAANYDAAHAAEYFAVLIPSPANGSEQRSYIAPVAPDATVGAWTHGTDTLQAGTVSFAAATVCIWAPHTKSIPYKFDVFAPDGTHIELSPAPGADDHAWFCAEVPEAVGNAIGVWRVIVGLVSAGRVPAIYPPRHAALNPDALTFPPVDFELQPLLLVQGPRPTCATLRSIAVTAGCAAPNRSVTLTADVLNPEHVVEWNWDFGDGTTSPSGAGQTVTHTYAINPTGPASLMIVREAGCTPLTQIKSVQVTPCNCPNLTGIEVVRGCAPGRVTFRATGDGLGAAQGFLWNFGDGVTLRTTGPEAYHTYTQGPAVPGSITVSVVVISPESCAPSPPQSLAVPACCPILTGVEVMGGGCAPGIVEFRAFGENLGAAVRFHWDFGDGTTMDTDGPEASHPYTEAPSGPGTLSTTVTMVSPANCPIRAPQRVQVPACPVTCAQILNVRIVSDNRCAPGTVTLQADVDHPEAVVEWNWLFGDGGSSHDAVRTEHTYTSAGPFQPSLSIVRNSRCRPIESSPRQTTVSPCPPPADDGSDEWPDDSPASISCLLLLLASALAILAGLILFPLGFCICIHTGISGWGLVIGLIMLIAGGILLAVGAGLFLSWVLACGWRPGFCPILNFIWEFTAFYLVPAAWLITAVVVALLQWCGLAVALDAAYLSFIAAVALWAARCFGCTGWPDWLPRWVIRLLPCRK